MVRADTTDLSRSSLSTTSSVPERAEIHPSAAVVLDPGLLHVLEAHSNAPVMVLPAGISRPAVA
jgi:hypothetical protein